MLTFKRIECVWRCLGNEAHADNFLRLVFTVTHLYTHTPARSCQMRVGKSGDCCHYHVQCACFSNFNRLQRSFMQTMAQHMCTTFATRSVSIRRRYKWTEWQYTNVSENVESCFPLFRSLSLSLPLLSFARHQLCGQASFRQRSFITFGREVRVYVILFSWWSYTREKQQKHTSSCIMCDCLEFRREKHLFSTHRLPTFGQFLFIFVSFNCSFLVLLLLPPRRLRSLRHRGHIESEAAKASNR